MSKITEKKHTREIVLHSIFMHTHGIGIRDISRLSGLNLQSVQRQVRNLKDENLIKISKDNDNYLIFYNYEELRAKAYEAFFLELERQELKLKAKKLSRVADNLFSVIESMQNFVRSYK